jgi:hypothetical protein
MQPVWIPALKLKSVRHDIGAAAFADLSFFGTMNPTVQERKGKSNRCDVAPLDA